MGADFMGLMTPQARLVFKLGRTATKCLKTNRITSELGWGARLSVAVLYCILGTILKSIFMGTPVSFVVDKGDKDIPIALACFFFVTIFQPILQLNVFQLVLYALYAVNKAEGVYNAVYTPGTSLVGCIFLGFVSASYGDLFIDLLIIFLKTIDDYDHVPVKITGRRAGKSLGSRSWRLCLMVVGLCSLERVLEGGFDMGDEVEKYLMGYSLKEFCFASTVIVYLNHYITPLLFGEKNSHQKKT